MDNPYESAPRDTHAVDGRKLGDEETKAIAKTDLQKGFMALIRAIAKPETF